MISKIFLDANIVLDFTLQRRSYDACRRIMEKAILREIFAYISPSILHISGYWLAKSYGQSEAKRILVALTETITVIDCPHDVAVAALNGPMNDIEDAIQYHTALFHRMDTLISLDKKFQKYSSGNLPIHGPTDFLASLS